MQGDRGNGVCKVVGEGEAAWVVGVVSTRRAAGVAACWRREGSGNRGGVARVGRGGGGGRLRVGQSGAGRRL